MEIFEFLKLLKRPEEYSNEGPSEISEEIFINVIKRSKKHSTLSVFSR